MLKKSENANVNYLTKIIKLVDIRKHVGADKLQCVTIDGNNVITGLSAQDGDLYVYFPTESALNSEYLAWSNSYENKEMNADHEKKGFFNKHGRVRAIRLRSERSEGYIIPVSELTNWLTEVTGKKVSITEADVNTEFDYYGDVKISEKYINRAALKQQGLGGNKNEKKAARQSKLVDGQFRFHESTSHLSKNIHKIEPNDLISITNKIHGTSFVVSKILCKKSLKWYEKLFKKLGLNLTDTHYDLLWSSRKVIKNQYNDNPGKNHFYSYDLWEDIAKILEPILTEGISIYGECAGMTKNNLYIQKDYDYGCQQNKFKIYVYRITFTNTSGEVFEFSAKQTKDYCVKFDLNYVPEYYYGFAKDLFNISTENHWQENFLQKLSETYLEKDCDICLNKVPAEGIIIRKESSNFEAFKHKSFRFRERESKQLDSGEVDMETQESYISND